MMLWTGLEELSVRTRSDYSEYAPSIRHPFRFVPLPPERGGVGLDASRLGTDVIVLGLREVTEQYDKHAMRALILRGADPLTANAWHLWVFMAGYPQVLKILIRAGVDPNPGSTSSRPALAQVAHDGYQTAVRMMLSHGASPNGQNLLNGETVLMAAADGGNAQIVSSLLYRGADVNASNNFGITALMIAAENGRLEIVRKLTKKKADVDATDQWGRTAWMLAAMKGHLDVVKCLFLEGRTSLFPESGAFKQAVYWANSEGHQDVVDFVLARAGMTRDEFFKRVSTLPY